MLNGNNNNTCRLAYRVWLLQQILEDFPRSTINLMYDVSCSLKNHLEVSVQVERGDRDELILHVFIR